MCGRFTLILNSDEIKEEFDTLDEPVSWTPDYNISPSKNLPILTNEHPLNWQPMRWGLNRTFSQQKRFIINIRTETLAEKDTFKLLLKNKRCIIPANGFYEWKKEGVQSKKSYPFYFTASENEPFAFAGVWDKNGGLENGETEFAIITCPANSLVNQVHGRMPVMLDKEGWKYWLSNIQLEEALGLLKPYQDVRMKCTAVSQQVNNPSYNSKDCIESTAGQQKFDF